MGKFIKEITIKNFKSIKELKLDLSRINLFIGRTNSGKTNILEAISLLGKSSGKEFYSDIINYESIHTLFNFSNIEEKIEVFGDSNYSSISNIDNNFIFFQCDNYGLIKDFDYSCFTNKKKYIEELIDNGIKIDEINIFWSKILDKVFTGNKIDETNIHYYKYKKNNFKSNNGNQLHPPFGDNLYSVVSSHKSIRDYLTNALEDYGIEVVYIPNENELKIQRKVSGLVYQLPFSMLADTLQRSVFYHAAIKSNKNSVLLFEEPEVHSYPPYIKDLAQNLIDSKENQFLITTHSPYLFDTLIENGGDEVSVFLIDYTDHNTIVKKLNSNEIQEILTFGYDVFFNLDNFTL